MPPESGAPRATTAARHLLQGGRRAATAARHLLQEARETGPFGLTFRAGWELAQRGGVFGLWPAPRPRDPAPRDAAWTARLPFACPYAVAEAMRPRLPRRLRARLQAEASAACRGEVVTFGGATRAYGDPIAWHRDPASGRRFGSAAPWWRCLTPPGGGSDIKRCWEVARFPHAFALARAAAYAPRRAEHLAAALCRQIGAFMAAAPPGRGIHWASGQETAVRLMAWTFALGTLLLHTRSRPAAAAAVARGLADGAAHARRYLAYARIAVPNNHLLAEALLLLLAGTLLPGSEAATWRSLGGRLLADAAARQFYPDGAYVQQSHSYQRVALIYLLWGTALSRAGDGERTPCWHAPMARALDFLYAQANPVDGTLPNFGANDGALPCVGSSCAFGDFRPLLQAVSLTVRGERLFRPGPWDEPACWLLGPTALDAPRRLPPRRSVSFATTGYHVLRGVRDRRSACILRAGSLRHRFGQMDMLHLDVTWRGINVLCDPGSYRYNGAAGWRRHFAGTASHNTVTVDGRDQMLAWRKFKSLYLTRARRLAFAPDGAPPHMAGVHAAYVRHPGGVVHRRTVWLMGEEDIVVQDLLFGAGRHAARLHWQGAARRWRAAPGLVALLTAAGAFVLTVLDGNARPLPLDVACGDAASRRGWVARTYDAKVAAPSVAAHQAGALPLVFWTAMGPGQAADEAARARLVGHVVALRDVPRAEVSPVRSPC